MTTTQRIDNLTSGQQIAITLNNYHSEVISGTVDSVSAATLRVWTGERRISISRDHGLIGRVKVLP